MPNIRFYSNPTAKPVDYEYPTPAHFLHEHKGELDFKHLSFFYGEPSVSSQITSKDELLSDIDCVVMQGGAGPQVVLAFQIISAIAAVASVIIAANQEMPQTVNRAQQSKNNSLSDRSNSERINQRVEDIYGQVRATPALMMLPYIRYDNNFEYEYSYMSIGRSDYLTEDIRDGDTLIRQISGAKASVFAPFTSPNSGDAPIIEIGGAINQRVINATLSKSVRSVDLRPPNELETKGVKYKCYASGRVQAISYPPELDFRAILEPGKEVNLFEFYSFLLFKEMITPKPETIEMFTRFNASGTYTVASVSQREFTITVPTDKKQAWDAFGVGSDLLAESWEFTAVFPNPNPPNPNPYDEFLGKHAKVDPKNETNFTARKYNSRTEGAFDGTVGPFRGRDGYQGGWINLRAEAGLFKVGNDGNEYNTSVSFDFFIYELDSDDANAKRTGNSVPLQVTLNTNSVNKRDQAAITKDFSHSYRYYEITGRRTTDRDKEFDGTVFDNVKWQQLYFGKNVDKRHFGDKTTIQTVTRATDVSTGGERKVNCLSTRLVYKINPDGSMQSTKSPSRLFGDILANIAIDKKFGRYQAKSINMKSLYDKQVEVQDYFGFPEAAYFDFTYDSEEISFDEAAQLCADAGFCKAYRRGSIIDVFFDKPQPIGPIFGHRNKIPNTDSMTFSFVDIDDKNYDGVIFVWVDPDNNESQQEIHIPSDRSATNPQKFELPGFRDKKKATIRAWREYLKILHQRDVYETTTTSEARILTPGQRVEIVNNTLSETMDGEVVQQEGLVLGLSEPVDVSIGGYEIVLSTRGKGTVESIPITNNGESLAIKLSRLPSYEIYTGLQEVRTVYSICKADEIDKRAYVVQEVSPTSSMTVDLKAVNYSDKIYSKDKLYSDDKAFNSGYSRGFA